METAPFRLDQDQRALRDVVERYIERRSPVSRVRQLIDDPLGFWPGWLAAAAEIGWFAMLVPPEFDGGSVSGKPVHDAIVIATEVGRHLQPGPFVTTNVLANAIASHGTDTHRQDLLPKIVRGEVLASWAYADMRGNLDYGTGLQGIRDGDEIVLNGARGYVSYGDTAEVLLVIACVDSRVVQLLIPAETPGLTRTALATLDLTRRVAHCQFDDVRVPVSQVLAGGVAAVDEQLRLACVLTCADTLGALDRLFSMTIQYAKTRVSFGRPIGSFQSLKHILADQFLYLETCRAGLAAAAQAVDGRVESLDKVVLMVGAYIGDVANDIAQECLQVHGGIGYTWEHDLHLYMRRIRANSALFGSSNWLRERLCRAYDLEGGGPRS